MTILPKKPSNNENECDTSDQLSHTTNENRGVRRNSPSRWLGQHTRVDDVRRPNHESNNCYEDFEFSKRRHRSPPHRSIRKHRHERPTSLHHNLPNTSSSLNVINHQRCSLSPNTNSTNCEDLSSVSGRNSEDEYEPHSPLANDDIELWFSQNLREKYGWVIRIMCEDGACLFRTVADQVYGDQEMHNIVRQNCCDYMGKNSDFFKHYITEDFTEYLNRKRRVSCHGNHIEMQAMSELYNRPIEVYSYSIEPINTYHGAYKTDNEPIRVSYHRNRHYNSLIDPWKATIGVGLGLPGLQPGLADKNLVKTAVQQSESMQIEHTMLEDKMKETDWEVTQESIEEQVARESYLQWLRDNEKRAQQQSSSRSASATCSSAASDASQGWRDCASSEPRSSKSPRSRSNPSSPKANEAESDNVSTNTLMQFPSTSEEACSTSSNIYLKNSDSFSEGASLLNEIPPEALGLSDWDEDDIIAQVIAQSQEEYLNSLKKNID